MTGEDAAATTDDVEAEPEVAVLDHAAHVSDDGSAELLAVAAAVLAEFLVDISTKVTVKDEAEAGAEDCHTLHDSAESEDAVEAGSAEPLLAVTDVFHSSQDSEVALLVAVGSIEPAL